MSVSAAFFSVIVRVAAIEASYPGGLRAFEDDAPNSTFETDGELARVGFMGQLDVMQFVAQLTERGLERSELALVEELHGQLTNHDWLEVDAGPDADPPTAWLAAPPPPPR